MDKVITFCQTATMIFQTHFFSDTCVKMDTFAGGNPDPNPKTTYSWLACRDICKTESTCLAWSYNPDKYQCVRRTSSFTFKPSTKGATAGKRNCPTEGRQ